MSHPLANQNSAGDDIPTFTGPARSCCVAHQFRSGGILILSLSLLLLLLLLVSSSFGRPIVRQFVCSPLSLIKQRPFRSTRRLRVFAGGEFRATRIKLSPKAANAHDCHQTLCAIDLFATKADNNLAGSCSAKFGPVRHKYDALPPYRPALMCRENEWRRARMARERPTRPSKSFARTSRALEHNRV